MPDPALVSSEEWTRARIEVLAMTSQGRDEDDLPHLMAWLRHHDQNGD